MSCSAALMQQQIDSSRQQSYFGMGSNGSKKSMSMKRQRVENDFPYQQWETLSKINDEEDDTFSETDDESCSATDDEEETLIAKAMVKAAFTRDATTHSTSLWTLFDDTYVPTIKKAKLSIDSPSPNCTDTLRISKSAPYLPLLGKSANPTKATSFGIKPEDYLRSMFNNQIQFVSSSSLPTFFVATTEEAVKSYDLELARALRDENMDVLLTKKNAGHIMQCGNKFGESVVHTACRRGSDKVLKFLIEDCRVSVKVCCDNGRTPMHDACWTSKPNFEVITVLLDQCPDLLYITDNRGYSPLAYISKPQWSEWCDFLNRRGIESLRPKSI